MEQLGQFIKKPAHDPEKSVENYDPEVDEILALQESWPEFVIPLEKEEIQELLDQGLMHLKKSESGEILATVYRKPLYELPMDDPNQVFKLGGMATLRVADKEKRNKSREAFKNLALEVYKSVTEEDLSVIMCTRNNEVAKLLTLLGGAKFSPEELEKNYPDLFATFMSSEAKPLEGEDFYFRPGRRTMH